MMTELVKLRQSLGESDGAFRERCDEYEYLFNERAAIMEYDAGMTKEEAEAEAKSWITKQIWRRDDA